MPSLTELNDYLESVRAGIQQGTKEFHLQRTAPRAARPAKRERRSTPPTPIASTRALADEAAPQPAADKIVRRSPLDFDQLVDAQPASAAASSLGLDASAPDAGTALKAPASSLGLSDDGLNAIKREEGLVLNMYNDQGGHCTIGFGHLIHMGSCSSDASGAGEADFKDGITEERALELLRGDVAGAVKAVQDDVAVDLTQAEFDALVSFAFNVGTEAFKKSGVLTKLNAKQYADVPTELRKWTKSGGKEQKDLVARRDREAKAFAGEKNE